MPSTNTPEENELIGTVAQCLLNDMAQTADLRVRLAESVGYDNGYQSGYDAGYAAAQRNMRRAMFGVQVAAGAVMQPEYD